jgi:hypothetical protein
MQHIKNYMAKVEKAIVSRTPKKSNKKGLLAPSKEPMQSEKKVDSDLSLIATYVASIRAARQEMLNGN